MCDQGIKLGILHEAEEELLRENWLKRAEKLAADYDLTITKIDYYRAGGRSPEEFVKFLLELRANYHKR